MQKRSYFVTVIGRTSFVIALAAGLLSCFLTPVQAEEKPFASTATGKASTELIKNFTNFVKDVTAMNGMTDQDKVNYILTKGKERINEVRAKRLKDTIKTKALDYIKARMRADLFKSQVPAMMNAAIVEGQSVASVWSKADVQIKSQLDTQMNAIKSAVSAAEIGWKVYGTWSAKGAEEGVRELGVQVGTKIIEYFVPGWGYYRLAQAAVEALGNYVVVYAFDTSLQEKMRIVLTGHDPRTDPAGFKTWILSVNIASYVQQEWDEQLAYGGWYLKGSNEGESMKKAIITALEKMKAEVKQRADAENQMRANLEGLDSEAKAAAAAVQATIDASGKEFEPILSGIDKFKSDIIGCEKQDQQEQIDESKQAAQLQAQQDSRFETAFKYSPFAHDSVLKALKNALSEITDGPGPKGYDPKAIDQGMADYLAIRQQVVGGKGAEVERDIKISQDKVAQAEAQYNPVMASLWAQIDDAWSNPARRNALEAQLASVSDAFQTARGPYMNIAYRNFLPEEFSSDQGVLAEEEQEVFLEARQRQVQFHQAMDKLAEELQAEVDKAAGDYVTAMAVVGEKALKLHYPGALSSPVETFAALAEQEKLLQSIAYREPGDVIKNAQRVETIKSDLLADKELLPVVQSEQRKIFEAYAATISSVVNRYRDSVPRALQIDNGSSSGNGWYEHALINNDPYPQSLNGTMLIEDYGIAGKRTYASIPRVWGSERGVNEQSAFLAALPDQTSAAIDGTLVMIDKLLTELEPKKNSDAVVLAFGRILEQIYEDQFLAHLQDVSMAQEKDRLGDMIFTADNAAFMYMEPDKTKGALYLTQLKNAWDNCRDLVKVLNNLKKGIARDVVYTTKFQEYAFPALDVLNTVPDRIALYDEALTAAKKTFADRLAAGNKYLDDAKKKLDDLDKNTWLGQKVKVLEDFRKDTILVYQNLYKNFAKTPAMAVLVQGWNDLDQKVQDAITKAGDDEKAANAKLAAQAAAQQQKQRDDEAAAQKTAATERIKGTVGYIQLGDQRLNSQPMSSASGLVQVDRSGLVNGDLRLTGRMSFMDNVDRMLISVDGGRTWSQLPVAQVIYHSFTPIAGVTYLPLLKVRLTTNDEVTLDFFNGIQGIVYQDIDYNQMVQDAIKAIADAYERADASAFSDLISRDYLGNKTSLDQGVRLDFDMFTSIKITIYINRIDRRGDQMVVDTRWDKTQTPRKTGQDQRTSGNTVMVFKLEDGKMKIYNLRGNLLYATMSADIAQASGLPAVTVAQIRAAADERNPVQPGAGSTTDAGGLTTATTSPGTSNIETGTLALTQNDAHPAVNWIQEYEFATAQYHFIGGMFGPVYDFRRREGYVEVKSGNGIQDLGAVNIDTVTSVPAGGYATDAGWAFGHCYAIQMSDGNYALVQSTDDPAITYDGGSNMISYTTHFKYRYQRNGTRDF